MKKLFIITISSLTLLTSCSEDINLSVAAGDPKIVIEGNIENGKHPEVIVTRNSPLTAAVDFSKILVTNAQVYVSDGVTTDTLHFGIDSFASVPFTYASTHMIGMVGQSYSLTVIADGKTYRAITTIPTPVPLDSVWWKAQPPHDTLGFAWAHFSEPAGLGNAYRWYAKRPRKTIIYNGTRVMLNRRFTPPDGATFDDKFVDGKTFDFAYDRSYDPTEVTYTKDEPPSERGYYKPTDTIYIKFCAIDYYTYRFYNTFEAALGTNGNPFASPVSILSNIDNGGLGVWAGLGATYDTIYPQH
jgi:hypothetical protein